VAEGGEIEGEVVIHRPRAAMPLWVPAVMVALLHQASGALVCVCVRVCMSVCMCAIRSALMCACSDAQSGLL